jgi:hypothetical protein
MTSQHTISIVLRAIDDASAPIRQIGRELDALSARLSQMSSAAVRPFASPSASSPAPIVIHVTVPHNALSSPSATQAAGETFGAAIARHLRSRG